MAVSISGTSGTWSHGEAVTISGSGFTTKATAAPVLWDTIDNQSAYSALSDGDIIPTGVGNPWPLNSNGDDAVTFENGDTMRHALSSEMYKVTATKRGYMDGLEWTATDHIYVSWWFKTNVNYMSVGDLTLHSCKFLRLSKSDEQTTRTFSWAQAKVYVFGAEQVEDGNWVDFFTTVDTWHFMEAWINSANRTFKVIIDNDAALSLSHTWDSTTAFQFNQVWRLGMDSDGNNTGTASTHTEDDIYVDKYLNRAMVGNASTYATCTAFEMQIPTSWSDTSIGITVNRGAYGASDTRWLYVHDSSGVVNSDGFEITFGEEEGSATGEAVISFGGARRRVRLI